MKFSIYSNRRVFVMLGAELVCTCEGNIGIKYLVLNALN